ncbi:RebB family R body protein [Reichenbachiella versicolor]|uniref:RebB family R body protein n=1 Tax=Reichenbachiella versicolor TaxID=1821036 RepID=UPI000D6E48C6|nr:RebB family R body protein [Reichenbachiella versicolor]
MSPTLIQSFIAMTGSIGMVMQNGASNQKNGQMVSTACTGVACAMIVKKGGNAK